MMGWKSYMGFTMPHKNKNFFQTHLREYMHFLFVLLGVSGSGHVVELDYQSFDGAVNQ